ncbi:relaxase/mobilization nuclease domain-containing protein [Halobacillus massiliensis]|uniref:relaxase/mobilization nuclease domain-containing protein n=1 Tax=Halobacillus massiliensis TaxID=1926286 RepID=UPI0009E33E00|nr:relaxase MobL [Halobacillus massiliensis]
MAATVVKMLGYLSNNGTDKPIHKAKEHIKYMEVNREHHRNNPDLFNQKENNLTRKDFFKSLEKMPNQGIIMHKFVISLREDDRDNLQIDLKELTRDTMERLQLSMDRRFEWVAAIHDDDGHPHVHVAVKGRDTTGRQVFFAQKDVKDLKRMAHQEKILQAERNPEVSRAAVRQSEKEAQREERTERSRGRGTGLLSQIQALIKQNERRHSAERSQEEREIERSNRGESR